MKSLLTPLLLLLACQVAASSAAERLICCGAETVFVVPVEEGGKTVGQPIWSWQAKDSPEISESMHPQFRTTDECKPYDERILITSSSGGVALIRRADKKCLFLASARNAHSACLLPEERIAVAASTGGDALLIFSLTGGGGADAKPLASLPLEGAHGAVWDEEQKKLWALGTHELLLVSLGDSPEATELAVENRWPLPTRGGHDLQPARDPILLFITTNSSVYQFGRTEHKFKPFKPLAGQPEVKSIDEHPATGRIVYHQANTAAGTWWSDTIRLLKPETTIVLPEKRLYKVRWDVSEEPE